MGAKSAKIERPKEFAAEAGSKCVIEEWERDKKEYTVDEDRMRLAGRWRVTQAPEGKARLRDLDFANPMLSVSFQEGDSQLGFASAPWQLEDTKGDRKIVGPAGTATYKFEKGQLHLEFDEGRFKGRWALSKTRTL